MPLTYSNPRTLAEIHDWPMGGGKRRGVATFIIEPKAGKGERAVRVTQLPGKPSSAPRVLTFGRLQRIVDGDDGRTYVISLTDYGHISVHRGDMQYSEESIFPDDPRYAAVRALFNGDPGGTRAA